ncbi:hypothetical protein TNIN_110881 [Trichonephila inaurata madagascariensis]|uniref:Uncharacterized protein n=1 Tax=Trichonephila inaurata madagascariensis TaxID=2747483 RepID=A0A8X7BZ83_9ARAC|nr:hypothetical protein TNIN_110881 [Trichonephila inaurata madagascariensis]
MLYLFQLSFPRRTSTENLIDTSPSTSTGEIMGVDPTPQKITLKEDKGQMQGDSQADSNVQLIHIQNKTKNLGPEYQNDIVLS